MCVCSVTTELIPNLAWGDPKKSQKCAKEIFFSRIRQEATLCACVCVETSADFCISIIYDKISIYDKSRHLTIFYQNTVESQFDDVLHHYSEINRSIYGGSTVAAITNGHINCDCSHT